MPSVRSIAVLALLLTTAFLPACIVGGDPVSEIDLPVPGELVVVRDTDDNDRGELYLINANGTDVRRIMEGQGYGMPVWSPDGQRLAAIADTSEGHPIVVIDVETGMATTLDAPTGSYESINWHPDGMAFIFSGIDHGREPVYPTPEAPGELARVGIIRPQIYLAELDGTPPHRLIGDDFAGMGTPTWSPDGTRIAFVGAGNQLWIAHADGSNMEQLSSDLNSVFSPSWSPDGNMIAYVGYPDEYPAVYVVSADGSDQRRVVPEGFNGSSPAWSPDGSEIAFSHYSSRRYELYVVAHESGELRELASSDGSITPTWSPDGEWIAFVAQHMRGESLGPTHLTIVNAHVPDAGAETIVRDLMNVSIPQWRPSAD